MKQKFLLKTMLLLCALVAGTSMSWAETVTFDASTDVTNASHTTYTTDVTTFNCDDGSTWKAVGFQETQYVSIGIGKGGANYLETPEVSGTITSVAVTWSGNANYYLALQTTTGTELEAKSNPSSSTTETFTVSGSYTQLRLVGRRSSGTSNALASISRVVVTYTPSSGPTTYTVTYNANGASSGSVPTDETAYSSGDEVTVKGNTGSLKKTDYTFNGWNTAANGSGTSYAPGTKFSITGNTTLYAQWVEVPVASTVVWLKTNLEDLKEDDIFVIVGNDAYALPNNGGTTNAPAATAVTVSGDKITSDVSITLRWNISGDASDGYTFYPNGDTSNWLYCNTAAASSSNNNLRVGTGTRCKFVLDSDGYLVTNDSNVDRYVSIYENSGTPQDWRGYTSTGSAAEISFYRAVEQVTLNSAGYATYASASVLNFTDSEAAGYSAWQITGVTGTTLNFSQITGAVEEGTGVLLKGAASATVDIPVAASGSDISGTNKLIGVTTDTDLEQVDGSYTNFGLSGDEFKKVASAGATIPANKAYLHILTSSLPSSVKALTFMFEEDADGLERVQDVQEVQGAIFNLAGQRLSKMQKGINIVNGKKILY
ncbi:MAG: InlB B-repeat-containing protein [Bacteroidaceae bacterium]|nr:InlB B-repeat-containing protein [Bacteroidaceae bacterium]